jgi:hypothetical protein
MKEQMPSLPAENRLPLKILESENKIAQERSTLWKVHAQHAHDAADIEKMVALKQVREEKFATPEEMRMDKGFYDFIKNFPAFGKFVLDTLYFKAQMTKNAAPQLFRLQRFIEGTPVDKMTDEELYRDPAVIRQLIELIDGAVELLKTAREKKMLTPDFRRAPEAAPLRVQIGMLISNPRYSSNIFVSEQPDENGQRVFYVDAAPNAQERSSEFQDTFAREIVGRLETGHFMLWKRKLEGILNNTAEG